LRSKNSPKPGGEITHPPSIKAMGFVKGKEMTVEAEVVEK